MHLAASNNDIHLIDYALKLGDENGVSNIDVPNKEGWTPAHFAGFLDNFDALNLLIENGSDVTKKNNNNLSCYEEMIRNDNKDLLECIFGTVKQDQKMRDISTLGSYSILHLAASSNGPKCLTFLLANEKESPNQICNKHDQATPLHFCVLSQNVENAKILLRYGANPNTADAAGNTPMHFAVSSQSLKMVKVLDEYGADATKRNIDDICPIDISITEDIKDIKFHFSSLP